MSLLKRSIEKKADRTDLSTMFDDHDYKLLTLDNNFLLLAQDLETFQKHMNKIQKSVQELQEVNKDVLLGKKALNCLSCNKGEDVRGPVAHVKGQDGRLYWGATAGSKRRSGIEGLGSDNAADTIEELTNFRSGSPGSSQPRMVGSRSNVFKNNSVSVSMHGQGLPSHFQMTDDNSNSLSRAGLANRGIGIKKQAARAKEGKARPDELGKDMTLSKKFELRHQIDSKKLLHKRSNTSA